MLTELTELRAQVVELTDLRTQLAVLTAHLEPISVRHVSEPTTGRNHDR